MPGATSIAIMNQIDDIAKRARRMVQRVNILLKSIIGTGIHNKHQKDKTKRTEAWNKDIMTNLRRLSNQQSPLFDPMINAIKICNELREERMNHIMSIENKRNHKIYDKDNMLIDEVVVHQGKDEFTHYINNIKRIEINRSADMEREHLSNTPTYSLLHTLYQMAAFDG
jgi:carboxypeptidase C (cathepsin A)